MKALILTGGKSSRMGTDKAALEFEGKTLLDHLVEKLKPLTPDIFLSIAHGDVEARDLPTLPDMEASPGPLGGLQAAFHHDPTCHWLVVGCDLPMLTAEDFENLLNQKSSSREAVCFQNPIDNQPEPLCALYSPSARATLEEAIKANRRCARKFIASLNHLTLPPTHKQSLLNLNRPEVIDEVRHLREHGINEKEVTIEYFAKLSQEAGTNSEVLRTTSATLAGLWEELRLLHRFSLDLPHVKPAINDAFSDWSEPLIEGQKIAFMPPFAGG